MAKIKKITAREILDSRGIPTIEGKLILEDGRVIRAQAASGEALSGREGVELRDGDPGRFEGLGVLKAVSYIKDLISKKLSGTDVGKFKEIDAWLTKADPSENRGLLGVNTLNTISQLVTKAAAADAALPLYKFINLTYNKTFNKKITIERLPGPIFNLINGGKHGNKNLEFQEFQVVPPTSLKFSAALQKGSELYFGLKKVLEYRNAGTSISEEGGFTPNLLTNANALEIIKETIAQQKMILGVDLTLGVDVGADYFYSEGKYQIKDKQAPLKPDDFINYLSELAKHYSIVMLEDPLQTLDFEGLRKLNDMVGGFTYIVGDDFLAGNLKRVGQAIEEKAASALLLKFNQVATISEMLNSVSVARDGGLKIIFSHRLGETNDSIIADIAVGIQADFVKFGPPVRGERVAKYNRLLEIEQELAS